MKRLLFIVLLLGTSLHAQVGIGTQTPANAALLDITSTDKGILIPRVALQSTTDITTITGAEITGLLVYNTNTINDVTPGFYYWDGSWTKLSAAAATNTEWSLTGNASTTPSTNFVGTTDAQDLVFRTNNTEVMRIDVDGNLGIADNNPSAQLEMNQGANQDAINISHAGATGNAIEINQNGTSNGSSAIWLRQNSTGRGINLNVLNSTNASDALFISNAGLGRGQQISMNNNSSISNAQLITQSGLGRGSEIQINNPASGEIAQGIFQNGLGRGLNILMANTGNADTGLFIDQHSSGNFGRGLEILMQATTTSYGSTLFQSGLGGGQYIDINNNTNNLLGSYVIHRGLGPGMQIDLVNATNPSTASFLTTDGTGRGQEISLNNATTTNIGQAVFHAGDGFGSYIGMTNTAATTNSMGQLIIYEGSGGGTGGGGNAVEIQNLGTNGNTVDIFTGNAGAAPGAANTTNEYATLSVVHMATGTASSGRSKSAIIATNHSEDPTMILQNSSNTTGAVLEAYIEPTTAASALATSIYARADIAPTTGYGVALWGDAGNYGVIGGTSINPSSSNFGLLSLTNSGAFGTKSFIIDYPLDPANKTLRHYSVESNEVLNKYRGNVTLDSTGKATVELPEYFQEVNVNPTYQLTAIGTPVNPYIFKEITGTTFIIAGEPNAKVSWEVTAQRNDPTLQYFNQFSDYNNEVSTKKPTEIGKYYVPAAYGVNPSQGVFYRDPALIPGEELMGKAIDASSLKPSSVTPPSLEPRGSITPEKPSSNEEQE